MLKLLETLTYLITSLGHETSAPQWRDISDQLHPKVKRTPGRRTAALTNLSSAPRENRRWGPLNQTAKYDQASQTNRFVSGTLQEHWHSVDRQESRGSFHAGNVPRHTSVTWTGQHVTYNKYPSIRDQLKVSIVRLNVRRRKSQTLSTEQRKTYLPCHFMN